MKKSLTAVVFAASSIAALTGIVATKGAVPPGSVSRAEGLEAWKRIEAVVTHPRCANCHVDAKAVPIWTPAGETKPRVHGMNIHGGESRIGAETVPCSTCHMTVRCSRRTTTTGRRRASTDGSGGHCCTRKSSTTATSGVWS